MASVKFASHDHSRCASSTRRYLQRFVPSVLLMVLLSTTVRAQIVAPADLQAVADDLRLKVDQPLAGMPLKGAGQKIKLKMVPPASGLTVVGTDALGGGLTLPVNVTAKWTFKNANGRALEPDSDYKEVADDLTSIAKTVVFKTKAVHWSDDDSIGSDKIYISIEATVTVEPLSPPLPGASLPPAVKKTINLQDAGCGEGCLRVPRLGIPKILALFRHTNFAPIQNGEDGFVLVLLPSNSPLSDIASVKSFLSNLQTALSNLAFVASFVGSAARVGLLGDRIVGQVHVRVEIGAQSSLGDVKMIPKLLRDVQAEDEISSLIFLADKGYKAYLFCHQEYEAWEPEDGYFVVEAGDATGMVVEIATLHKRKPTTSPSGLIDIRHDDKDDNFADSLSSIRFSRPPRGKWFEWLLSMFEDDKE